MKTRDTCDSGRFFCVVLMKKGRLIKCSEGTEGERGAGRGFVLLYVCRFVHTESVYVSAAHEVNSRGEGTVPCGTPMPHTTHPKGLVEADPGSVQFTKLDF